MSELLRAFCRAGHSWDVWAERDEDDDLVIDAEDGLCPSCPPPEGPLDLPSRAVRYEEPERLA